MTAWPLPLLSTTTGGRTPPAYCPECLDNWARRDRFSESRMHPACREVLEAICTAPAADEAGAA